MSDFSANYVRVQAVMSEMEAIDTRIRSRLSALEQDSARTLAQWTSQARDSYNVSKAQWDASAAEMPQALARAGAALVEIMTNYQTTDSRAAGLFPRGGR